MRRDLERFGITTFDVVIIGGGIYGAFAAWDAALRGLSVALLEQGDFGGATSANSQKIVHGGFRYLQHGDLRRMRQSIRERRALLRIAPHLVQLMPVVVPTTRAGVSRRPVLAAALALYDVIGWDRNAGLDDPARRVPRSRVMGRDEWLRRAPGLAADGVTGGALWHDGQIDNTERLTLAVVRAAADAGATAANYLRVIGVLNDGDRVTGVEARDALTDQTLTVRGRVVVNTAGPWVNQVLGLAHQAAFPGGWSKTYCLLLRRPLTHGHGIGVSLRRSARRLFFTPWRNGTLAGSGHVLSAGPEERVTPAEAAELLAATNDAYPGARLTMEDVAAVYGGLLPLEAGETDPARLTGRYQVRDHARTDGMEGLMSVLSVKFTTARDIAARAVTLAQRKLGRPVRRSRTQTTPVWGGAIARIEPFLDEAVRRHGARWGEATVRQLVSQYGTGYAEVLALAEAEPALGRPLGSSGVLAAQVAYAVRHEMAQTLSDVVFRRTELGSFGAPEAGVLQPAADVMARELGWDAARTAREVGAITAPAVAAG